MRGFCLREQEWEDFNIDGVEDVEFNTTPFDSLVLPEGYKELILAFVESQLKEGDSFEDVINGKGGGLVVLLSGVPGVGKTLTAESGMQSSLSPCPAFFHTRPTLGLSFKFIRGVNSKEFMIFRNISISISFWRFNVTTLPEIYRYQSGIEDICFDM